MQKKKSVRYEKRIIAFIDILGFKNIVRNEYECEKVNAILKLPYYIRKDDLPKISKLSGVMMTSISDSIVISVKISNPSAMNKIVRMVTVLVQSLLSYAGILLRGGIALGKVFHDEEVVYGPGLVNAYELESKLAIYPRIIISEKDLDEIVYQHKQISAESNYEKFKKDKDGMLYLDIFKLSNKSELYKYLDILEENATTDILRVRQKKDWMKQEIKDHIVNIVN